jgi:hypothetical protein
MSSSLPAPQLGQIQIVVYPEDSPILITAFPAAQLRSLVDGVEAARQITPEQRRDRHFQISGRMYVSQELARPDIADVLIDHLAAEILWLCVRHFGQTDAVQKGIDDTLREHGYAVLSVSITTGADDAVPSTRWGICVGQEPFDKRKEAAALPAGDIHIFGTSVKPNGVR